MPPLQRPLGAQPWVPLPEAAGRLQALAGGNSVSLLAPSQAATVLLEAVDGARNHINVETDGFPCDDLGSRLVDRLAERARAGVRVNLLHNIAGHARTAPVLQRLTGDAVRHSRFRPAGTWLRWLTRSGEGRHRPRRMVGVDGRVGFLATGDAGEATGWNQTRLRLEGPIVQRLQREFVASWQQHSVVGLAEARYFPPLAVRGTQGVALGPIQASGSLEPCGPLHSALLGAIQSAATSVCVALASPELPRRLVTALLRACARGVRVRLWMPPARRPGGLDAADAGCARMLAAGGVQVQSRGDSLQGCTVCVIDQRWTSLGCGQADWRSILDRCETDLIVADERFAQQLLDEIDASGPLPRPAEAAEGRRFEAQP